MDQRLSILEQCISEQAERGSSPAERLAYLETRVIGAPRNGPEQARLDALFADVGPVETPYSQRWQHRLCRLELSVQPPLPGVGSAEQRLAAIGKSAGVKLYRDDTIEGQLTTLENQLLLPNEHKLHDVSDAWKAVLTKCEQLAGVPGSTADVPVPGRLQHISWTLGQILHGKTIEEQIAHAARELGAPLPPALA